MEKPTKKKIVFDLDGCLCTQTGGDYENAQPIKEAIKVVNDLYRDGYHIIIHTARFMNRFGQNPVKAHEAGYEFTKNQLKKWGVLYNDLVMGKPSADIVVDDRALDFPKDWNKIEQAIRKTAPKN